MDFLFSCYDSDACDDVLYFERQCLVDRLGGCCLGVCVTCPIFTALFGEIGISIDEAGAANEFLLDHALVAWWYVVGNVVFFCAKR